MFSPSCRCLTGAWIIGATLALPSHALAQGYPPVPLMVEGNPDAPIIVERVRYTDDK
jgi:hypothetical protein